MSAVMVRMADGRCWRRQREWVESKSSSATESRSETRRSPSMWEIDAPNGRSGACGVRGVYATAERNQRNAAIDTVTRHRLRRRTESDQSMLRKVSQSILYAYLWNPAVLRIAGWRISRYMVWTLGGKGVARRRCWWMLSSDVSSSQVSQSP